MRVRRGGGCYAARREEGTGDLKKIKPNFSFRRVSEVMEGVRLQGMRATASKSNLPVSNPSNIVISFVFLKNVI